MKKIILASTSPRRQELLARTGLVFEVVASNYEEDMTLPLEPHELAKQLSKGKAVAVAQKYNNAIIISADTFIVFADKILGKPHTPEKAKETLTALRGNTHLVITGFTILDTASNKSISRTVETKVHFRTLTDEEIEQYIATGEPLDKAGAYGIQGMGSELVDKIEGSYSNIVGLPIEEIMIALKEFGVQV
ncbi:MAG: Septum formation protein Maf [Dehalococcoidia bacterium]|nr:Septum formation protein Maf [Bacillota bacterium]